MPNYNFAWILFLFHCYTLCMTLRTFDEICNDKHLNTTCDSGKKLRCGPRQRKLCECEAPPNDSLFYKWDKQAQSCVLVKNVTGRLQLNCSLEYSNRKGFNRITQEPICKLDSECHKSTFGLHSKCNLESCSCECLPKTKDESGNLRTVRNIGGSCYLDKILGDKCGTHEECQKTIEGHALCSQNDNSTCACAAWYIEIDKKCLLMVRKLNEQPCTHNEQCSAEHSYCHLHDELSSCRCGNGTRPYNDACYAAKGFEESCTETAQCILGSGPGSVCAMYEMNSTGTCQCKSGFFFAPATATCLEIGFLHSPCTHHAQCTHGEALGELSDCVKGQCVCSDIMDDDEESSVGYLNGTCWRRRELNESCSSDEECLLGNLDLACTEHTCECRNGTNCDQDKSQATLTTEPFLVTTEYRLMESSKWTTPIIVIASAFILTILSTGLLVAYSNWRKIKSDNELELKRVNQPLLRNLGHVEVFQKDYEIDRNCILGSGRNGIVYRGFFKPKNIPVAIKTNKEDVSSEFYLRAILEEAKVLVHLGRHKNIVQLHGICQHGLAKGHVYLLNELCPLGSLETFLRTQKQLFEFHRSAPDDRSDYRLSTIEGNKIQIGQLYSWAFQIAEGMEFIAAKKVIHSDLATRNILLSCLNTVKLTDFGLSRRLYDNYTYLKTNPDPLPWKWLDFDALRFMMFTTHTDIWSFGITVWEIFTLGQVPYPGIVTPWCQDFMQRLLEGLRPTKPEYASDELFMLMNKCWNGNKEARPSFTKLKESLFYMMKKRSGRAKEEVDNFGYLVPVQT